MSFRDMERLPLFDGLNRVEIRNVYECFGGEIREYAKGEIVIHEGDEVKRFGVVLGGQAHSLKNDVSGKSYIVTVLREGGYIGILLAGSAGRRSPVTVVATDRLTVMFLPFNKLVRLCNKNCSVHARVILNFIGGISQKAMLLHERNDCLIKTTIREKVMTYLTIQSQGISMGKPFEIPLDREELAQYLNVDRSALSRELSKMKKENIIDYYKSTFRIIGEYS
ncbi:MAG: Crp/Fnr family transcriptional regulator [Oscillospiraceae bacterium]|nr:Crp/Fnr family transcriptional regulator [Oscillospiraceae bacterium]